MGAVAIKNKKKMSNKYKHGKYRISIADDKNIQNKVVSITDDTGVYVREGNKLIFKRVRILCTGEGYYVVAELTSKDKNYKSYLALNDVIVTSGKGLEEGYKN